MRKPAKEICGAELADRTYKPGVDLYVCSRPLGHHFGYHKDRKHGVMWMRFADGRAVSRLSRWR